jgi:hypothetical protein
MPARVAARHDGIGLVGSQARRAYEGMIAELVRARSCYVERDASEYDYVTVEERGDCLTR